jgi:hypothetical protein
MRFKTVLSLLALACAPGLAHAGMYKCVGQNGTIIFSDRPCETWNGEKAAEIKDQAAFAAVLARDNASSVAQTCAALERRMMQCNAGLNATLASNLREHCRAPLMRHQQSQRYGRYREQDESYRDDMLANARCDALQAETWVFVKANFAKKMSEQDIKSIEYNLLAIPSDGRTPDLGARRRYRNP